MLAYNQTFVTNDAHDYYGHGGHVAGIIAGNGSSSTGSGFTKNFKGIAPNANLINLKVLDGNGNGTDSNVIKAIQTAIALKKTYNIRVINLSLGRPVFESYTLDPLCQAVEAAWKAGIVVVAAAGNEGRNNSAGTSGYGTIMAPGKRSLYNHRRGHENYGHHHTGRRSGGQLQFQGPTLIDHIVKPDLVAPGNLVVSVYDPDGSLWLSYPGNGVSMDYFINSGDTGPSNLYYMLKGTSMATPKLSRSCGTAPPGASFSHSRSDQGQAYADCVERPSKDQHRHQPRNGSRLYHAVRRVHGRGDIAAALADTATFTGAANSPVATLNSSTNFTGIVCGAGSICASAPPPDRLQIGLGCQFGLRREMRQSSSGTVGLWQKAIAND